MWCDAKAEYNFYSLKCFQYMFTSPLKTPVIKFSHNYFLNNFWGWYWGIKIQDLTDAKHTYATELSLKCFLFFLKDEAVLDHVWKFRSFVYHVLVKEFHF